VLLNGVLSLVGGWLRNEGAPSEECQISQLREWTYHIHRMTPMKFILELINREHTTLVNTIVNRLPKEHLNKRNTTMGRKKIQVSER
jgi:hypothetical protein